MSTDRIHKGGFRMKKVYVVTSGCYSDCSIDAIFSTKEEARKYIRERPSNIGCRLEEWQLDFYTREWVGCWNERTS